MHKGKQNALRLGKLCFWSHAKWQADSTLCLHSLWQGEGWIWEIWTSTEPVWSPPHLQSLISEHITACTQKKSRQNVKSKSTSNKSTKPTGPTKTFRYKTNWGKRGLSISKVGTFAPPRKDVFLSDLLSLYFGISDSYRESEPTSKKLDYSYSAPPGQGLKRTPCESGKRMVEDLK